MAWVFLPLAAVALRADGISLSTDGLLWTKGVGGYGDAWGESGTGVSIRQGSTVYIKFYSQNRDRPALHYADHGRKVPNWTQAGPVLTEGVGDSASNPVILRITDAGTRRSTLAWVNSPEKSGIWAGIKQPGSYDLALHYDAQWKLPPLTITEDDKPGFWGNLIHALKSDPPPRAPAVQSVSDQGTSALLLGVALALLWTARSRFHR